MKTTVIIFLLFIAQIATGQDRVHKIDSLLNSLFSNKKFNGNILIAEKGKVIYSKSFGFSNETTKEKLNENSVFELASCSKQFTAMAIMILSEKGKLNLDDEIKEYLPELSFYKGVTIRNLLNHTGGLPDYMQLMDSLFDKSKIATNNDIISIFSKHQPKILFEPNSKWEYSNTGYAILASIVENVSGLTYSEFLDKNIFKPLKMENTLVYTRRYLPKKIGNYAFGYVYSDSLKEYILPDDYKDTKMVIWLDGIVGDGCVNSTVIDLLKWDRALYTTKLLTSKGMKQLFEVGVLNDKWQTFYSFGWFVDSNADFGKIVSHTGGWPGYSTYIDRHIDNDKTIILLQNHDGVTIPIESIRCILYNKPLPLQKVRKEIILTNQQVQKFEGFYETNKGIEIKIFILWGQYLFLQYKGEMAFQLAAESELSFFSKVKDDTQIKFEQNEKGEITKLDLLKNGNKTEAKKTK